MQLDKVILILIIISLAGILSSLIIPKYTDESKIKELSEIRLNNELTEKHYIDEYLKYTTVKYEIQNIFTGLLTFFTIIFVFLKTKKIFKITDIFLIKTINKRKIYFLLINIGILFILIGSLEILLKEDHQYPIYDNSAQAVFGLFFLSIILFPIINLYYGVFLFQFRQKNTFFNFEFKSARNYINGIILITVILLLTGLLMTFIYYGSIFGVIASQIFIYVSISILTEINYKTVLNSGS